MKPPFSLEISTKKIQRSFPQAVIGAFALIIIILDTFILPLIYTHSSKVDQEAIAQVEQRRFGTFRQGNIPSF